MKLVNPLALRANGKALVFAQANTNNQLLFAKANNNNR